MPGITILDRIHLPRAGVRAAPQPVAAAEPAAPRASRSDPRRALFLLVRSVHAAGDMLAALRDRLPSRRNIEASTLLAYGAAVVMAAIILKDVLAPTPANSSVTPTPDRRPEWIEIARPHASFALESSMLHGLDARYDVQRHRLGGGRKDTLTFGHAEEGRAYMRLSLYRPGREGMAEPDPLEAVATLAASSGINAEIQETSGKLRTKFGDLPAVNMRVEGGNGWRNCLAVAGAWSDPRLGLVAWWCNPGPEMVALGEFACLLDRTALMSAGGDEQLAEFFARAELKRNYCNGQSSFVSPTPRLGYDWTVAKQGAPLRGRLSAR